MEGLEGAQNTDLNIIKDLERVSQLLEANESEDDSENDFTDYWREKLDDTIAALESCEKNKNLLERQNAELRRDKGDSLVLCKELKATIATLREECKELEKDKERLKESNERIADQVRAQENELAVEKEKAKQNEKQLEENYEKFEKLMEEKGLLQDVYEKQSVKTKALVEFGEDLMKVKDLLQSKIEDYKTKVSDKEAEIKNLQTKSKIQSAELDEFRLTVLEISDALKHLKCDLEKGSQKRAELENGLDDVKKCYKDQQEKLFDECNSQALNLQKAYHDCEVYCKRILELEQKIEEQKALKDFENAAEVLQDRLNFKEEELVQIKANNSMMKERIKDLEMQVSGYRDEIQNLRAMISEERSGRAMIEDAFEKKEFEHVKQLEEVDELKSDVERLKRELDVKSKSHEMTDEALHEMRREKVGLINDIERLEQEHKEEIENTRLLRKKLDAMVEENEKLKEEMLRAREDSSINDKLKAENLWLKNVNEESAGEISNLKDAAENLKDQVWKLQQSAIEAAAERESLEKLKLRCSFLVEEKKVLLKLMNELKEEKKRLVEVNEEIKETIWKAKQEKAVAQLKIKELDDVIREYKQDKESMLKKAEQIEAEHKERIQEKEKQWEEKLKDKEIFYDKQLKRKEANDILIRRMEEKLAQKEAQLEIKKGEMKRILLQYADLKNDKTRYEKKIDSLLVTERTLQARIQTLEPQVGHLEKQEAELVKRLEEKEAEMKQTNENWGRIAAKGMEEITQAIWGKGT